MCPSFSAQGRFVEKGLKRVTVATVGREENPELEALKLEAKRAINDAEGDGNMNEGLTRMFGKESAGK
jgi:hypothetical protein